jgi:hypothetical protein
MIAEGLRKASDIEAVVDKTVDYNVRIAGNGLLVCPEVNQGK